MIMNRERFKPYDPALIERARALGEEIGAARAAKVLGISHHAIQGWIRRKRDGKYMSKEDTPEQKELVEVKRELNKLKKENSDLKKANTILKELASFFSKDHPPISSEWSLNSSKRTKQK